MIFKADTQHALRAVTALAREGQLLPTARLAALSGAPEPALAKVLQRLAQHGIVAGRPGPGGGYVLKRAAAQIPLIEIVLLFEGHTVAALVDGSIGPTPWPDAPASAAD